MIIKPRPLRVKEVLCATETVALFQQSLRPSPPLDCLCPTLSRPSDLVQGVALSTTALMPFRFFAQRALFSVSPSSFGLSHADIVRNIITVIRAGC